MSNVYECECGEELCEEDRVYSPLILLTTGDEIGEEEILYADDLEHYEADVKKRYSNIEYIRYGEFCPYCLQSTN